MSLHIFLIYSGKGRTFTLMTPEFIIRLDELSSLRLSWNQSAPACKVADQLGVIIGVFCAFGILMLTSVKIFASAVQLELIASGQPVLLKFANFRELR
jgi:hypothetical protein